MTKFPAKGSIMQLYKFIPKGGFHFGERGIGIEETAFFPHSDTLFAALISAWRFIYDKNTLTSLEEGVTTFQETPPFRLSSGFPYAGTVYFLPRPAISLEGQRDDRKLGKAVVYLSWQQAENLINSSTPDLVHRANTLMDGQVWLDALDQLVLEQIFGQVDRSRIRLWHGQATRARVTVDRVSSASALYYEGSVQYAPDCGFYALAQIHDERYRRPLEDGLRFLGEQGLGGRRSVGLGQFDLAVYDETPPMAPVTNHNYYWLLSLYHPTLPEVSQLNVLSDARYNLVARRGWLYSPDGVGQRRRGIRMLTEGSLLTQPANGDVVDVHPVNVAATHQLPHAVWRSGLALTIPTERWPDA